MAEVELSYTELTMETLAGHIPDPSIVKSLDISGNNITPEMAIAIIDTYIAKMPHLKLLDIKDNKLGTTGSIHLFETLGKCCPQLEYLDVNENAMQDAALFSLATYIAKSRLKTLNVVTNHITPRGLPTLCDGLIANGTIKELSLAFNLLGDEGAGIVASMLCSHRSLESLDLSDNRIGDIGAVALATTLIFSKESKIVSLNLSVNKIGDVGFQAIAEALVKTPNKHLTTLDLGCNDVVTDVGRAALVREAPNMKHIYSIDFTSCDLSDDDARGLIVAIRSPSSLTSVEWYNNPRMTLPVEKELYEAIKAKEAANIVGGKQPVQQLVVAVGLGAVALALGMAAFRRARK